MQRFPLGIPRFDTLIGGGAPTGSTVLLAGEAGAGAREFVQTSALLNGLKPSDTDLYDLHYGTPPENAKQPNEIHYISFTQDKDLITDEFTLNFDNEIVEEATKHITFTNLSEPYFNLSVVPQDWYQTDAIDIHSLGDSRDRTTVSEALGQYMTEHAPDNLIVVDSLTDLITASTETASWTDIIALLKGLQIAARRWNALILLHVNTDTVTDTELGQLADSADGTILFEWESGGNQRTRTMYVQQYRNVLPRLEDEDIIQFETEINSSGFDISDIRKIS